MLVGEGTPSQKAAVVSSGTGILLSPPRLLNAPHMHTQLTSINAQITHQTWHRTHVVLHITPPAFMPPTPCGHSELSVVRFSLPKFSKAHASTFTCFGVCLHPQFGCFCSLICC